MARDGTQRPKVVSIRADVRKLEERIRALARDTKNILWSSHVRERMEERGFFPDDVLRILRAGYAKGDPEKTELGEWKVKMAAQIKGAREAGVITILMHDDRLFLKTVEWEDVR